MVFFVKVGSPLALRFRMSYAFDAILTTKNKTSLSQFGKPLSCRAKGSISFRKTKSRQQSSLAGVRIDHRRFRKGTSGQAEETFVLC